jgi:hypothetical protein
MFDTTGMLHTCGKKLTYAGIDNGCRVLVCRDCTDKYGSEVSYRISIEDPRKLPFPWEIPRVKVYHCRDCPSEITEEQAKRTFNEEGRALCVRCEGREHGIEIMGFE